MKEVIIIHGYTSLPKRKRFVAVSKGLKSLGMTCTIPAMPGGKHPLSQEWLKLINEKVKASSKPVILVGHSLGTRAVLLYLDKFEQKVDTVILISAFNNNVKDNQKRRGGVAADFFKYPLDIRKIRKLANKFIVVHSKDDDEVEYQQGVDISKQLGAKLVTYEDRGHFKGEENAGVFLQAIKSAL
jgi:predicted alpha/beta hydrolase family esterase